MIHYGLKGISVAETKISYIDGEKGELLYRGIPIQDLTKQCIFEETAYLLLNGKLPDKKELQSFIKELKLNRRLPSHVKNLIQGLPKDMDMMGVLRTVISAEGSANYRWKPSIEQAVRLIAITPIIIAYRKRYMENKELVEPNLALNHTANYLYMLNGNIPSAAHTRALESYMILTMEHGMNASAFSARVTASTESDLISAIAAAIGTMKGPLHGGAPAEVISLLQEVKDCEDADSLFRGKIMNGEKLMGFGHRVYKTFDPRANALKEKLKEFDGQDEWLDLAIKAEEIALSVLQELKPGRGLYTNVEYYAAAIMKAIGMEQELFTPTFTASRMPGWCAHVLEQADDNVIFRPDAKYIGVSVSASKAE